MKNIRKQAELMGHTVVGKLKRLDNCVIRVKGQDREYSADIRRFSDIV